MDFFNRNEQPGERRDVLGGMLNDVADSCAMMRLVVDALPPLETAPSLSKSPNQSATASTTEVAAKNDAPTSLDEYRVKKAGQEILQAGAQADAHLEAIRQEVDQAAEAA